MAGLVYSASSQNRNVCYRLQKECSPSGSARKRSAQNSSAARAAKLEEKLDGIVSLLQSVTGSNLSPALIPDALVLAPSNGVSSSYQTHSTNSTSTPVSSIGVDSEPQGSRTLGTWGSASINSTSLKASPMQNNFTQDPHILMAERCLAQFISQMLPNFACINLPSNLSAVELSQTRPFLMQTIMVVTCTSVQERDDLTTKLLTKLTHEVFILSQGHLDHLLGLLIFLAWCSNNGNKNHLMQLAISLAADLRLNKPLDDEGTHKFERMTGCETGQRSEVHTSEQRRAALGCFFLSSLISMFFGRLDAMQWTPQMEEHLRIIEETKECAADESFAIQIRLQLLLYKSSRMRDFDGGYPQGTSIPSVFQLKAVQTQLNDIRASIPPHLQQDVSVMASFHYTNVSIHERAYPADTPLSCNITGPHHLQCLCTSLSAAKSFIDLLFSMPQSQYLGLPLHFRIQAMRCLVALYRLSIYGDPAWDKQAVRDTVDVIAIFDRILIDAEQRSAEIENPEDDVMIQVCNVMKGFRAFCLTKLPRAESSLGDPKPPIGNDSDMLPYFMDLADDAWLQDALGWSTS
ncbi:hypothetical protein VTL71DRAFT_5861 [Oculimacula yallundae]|uniref:Xylanolytic transcriptional activator regulatory domain-containing protein n=1 Tax=Oculimacula yallundae TaxID=86028 RepID=A0ABR4BYP3_9HELO